MSIYDKFDKSQIKILKERAARFAASKSDADEAVIRSALTLHIRGEKYAFPVDALTAVYENMNIVPIPCTPPYVSGIANIRGRIVAVLELGVLLNVPDVTAESAQGSLIVASDADNFVAFRVEQIGDVHTFFERDLEANDGTNPYLQGLLPDSTALLNMSAILNDPALVVNDTLI